MAPDRFSSQSYLRCLITGASGFIGRNLVLALLRTGSDVRVLRRTPHSPGVKGLPLEEAAADLWDREALVEAMRGVDVVYHLAGAGSPASPPEDYLGITETNITGTLNVLLAAASANVRRVVIASSASVYGRLSSPALREDMVPQPASVYAISKLSAEHMCGMVHQSYGVEMVALRYFNVYGPGEDPQGRSTKLIPSLIRRLRAHDSVTLFGDGGQTRDFVHVDDAVRATILAGTVRGINHVVLNIGSGEATTVHDVARLLSERLETKSGVIYEIERPNEIRHSVADIGRAQEVLGYSPSISFREGIVTLVDTASQQVAANRR